MKSVSHSLDIAAPAADIYALIADARSWPVRFGPTIHVDRLEHDDEPGRPGSERLRIWATAGGTVKSWTSRRELDPTALRVSFRQEVSQPPVAAMSGEWTVTATGPISATVVLAHSYAAVDDDPAGLAWIDAVCDANSRAELANLKSIAESAGAERDDVTFSFVDELHVAGSADDVFAFLDEADRWPERLPHVADVRFATDGAGVQNLEMITAAPDGTKHTTCSVRVSSPEQHRIVYKQTVVPALMSAHTGRWRVVPADGGVVVSSQHTVVIDPAAVEAVLGAGATVADARSFAQHALSTNSGITLRHARDHAEARAVPVTTR